MTGLAYVVEWQSVVDATHLDHQDHPVHQARSVLQGLPVLQAHPVGVAPIELPPCVVAGLVRCLATRCRHLEVRLQAPSYAAEVVPLHWLGLGLAEDTVG